MKSHGVFSRYPAGQSAKMIIILKKSGKDYMLLLFLNRKKLPSFCLYYVSEMKKRHYPDRKRFTSYNKIHIAFE